jgi:hypothetical protein
MPNLKRQLLLVLLLLTGAMDVICQQTVVDFNLAVGSTEGCLSGIFYRQWNVGRNDRFLIGSGLRLNGYLGKNRYYITAPAKLTSGETGPQVLFIENIQENIDTFLVKTAQVNSINILIDFQYRFTAKLSAGFNIDVIGFSFGNRVKGNYINGYEGKNVNAHVSPFNLLLISDNDLGMLNSELYVKHQFTDRISLKGGAQFLFTEYTTDLDVQQVPEPNNRFRKKSLMFSVGISLKLKTNEN